MLGANPTPIPIPTPTPNPNPDLHGEGEAVVLGADEVGHLLRGGQVGAPLRKG